MSIPVILAKIIGPLALISGIGSFDLKKFTAFSKDPGKKWGLLVMGYVNSILGLTTITLYNVWTWSPYLIVTITGWMIFIFGLFQLGLPADIMYPPKKYTLKNPEKYFFSLLGAALIWVGYFLV